MVTIKAIKAPDEVQYMTQMTSGEYRSLGLPVHSIDSFVMDVPVTVPEGAGFAKEGEYGETILEIDPSKVEATAYLPEGEDNLLLRVFFYFEGSQNENPQEK